MTIIDTHAHLDHLDDPAAALARAAQAGVDGIVAVSMDLVSCHKNLDLLKTAPAVNIYLGLGMHPSEATRVDVSACQALIAAHHAQLHAVGEIGLDFWYKWVRQDQEKREEQIAVYRSFLEMAHSYDLPAVIHSRGAWKECLRIAQEMHIQKAVFHWYSGPLDVLGQILDAGYYVSTTPSLAYSAPSREAMSYAPIERTLIETDCPVYYAYPRWVDGQPKRGKEGFKAEPQDVWKTLEAYCGLKGCAREAALMQFNENARQFFGC